jgi:hypothetical protein
MRLNMKISILGLALIALTACKKETPKTVDVIQPGTSNPVLATNAELKAFYANNLNAATQSFVIDAAAPNLITGSKGTKLQFSPNSFETMSGQSVTGNVTITMVEIFSKADMIMMNKPTMGKLPSGGLGALISGGEMKITASQNGQTLRLKPGFNYDLQVPAAGGVDPNMGLFYGENGNDTLVWTAADSAIFTGQGNTYFTFPDSLNWINCDYFNSNPNPKTVVQVQVPAGFNGTNCSVFISFDGLNSLTAFYNYSNGVFTTFPSYQLPTTLPVHFIVMAIINGNPHVAIVPSTIVNNHLEVIPALTQMTPAQLATALANLP